VAEESKKERIDRELIELLNELRVALPGVQVLFAFLLIVPFSNGYSRMTAGQKDIFFATFVSTALSTAFLIAPSANHRILFRQKDKERLLLRSNLQSIVGLGFLALSIVGVVTLITDVIFESLTAGLAAGGIAIVLVALWFGFPAYRRITSPRDEDSI
jgi:amino acid transporter